MSIINSVLITPVPKQELISRKSYSKPCRKDSFLFKKKVIIQLNAQFDHDHVVTYSEGFFLGGVFLFFS